MFRFLFALTLLILSSCSYNLVKENDLALVEHEIYNEAVKFFKARKYPQAVERFQDLQRLYSYTVYAERSLLASAYISHIMRDYTGAATYSHMYTEQYPNGKYLAYAYYIEGLSYFSMINGYKRSQAFSLYAHDAFTSLISKFPDTKFIEDAQVKLLEIRSVMAEYEIHVGTFYLSNSEYLAAIKRFETVINNYYDLDIPTIQALQLIIKCCEMLGLKDGNIIQEYQMMLKEKT